MTSTVHFAKSFLDIDSDIPGEQTLAEWRRDRDAVRRAERRVRRTFRLPLLRPRW